MSYTVAMPPKDDEAFVALSKELFEAAIALGLTPEPNGFLAAWVNGVKVLVERDEADTITGIAFMAVGTRWTDSANRASLLECACANPQAMLDFAKNTAYVLGADSLFFDMPVEHPTAVARNMRELKL